MKSKDFWAGKRVLVTGHTGFKGSWLTLWLKSLGADVTGYALDPATDPSLWRLLGLQTEITNHIADIRDFSALARVLKEARPDIVFHLAAQSLVRSSYGDPVGTYATNVMGTVHLLEVVRQTLGVRAVVNVTSDKCYENRKLDRGYSENDPMGGRDPYSSSKGCSELVTAAYRNSFFERSGPALASARAGNVIGGGDWADDRLVPDFVRATMRGEQVQIRNPLSVRPWQHVLEPLYGYLLLAERLSADGRHAGGWNFGPALDNAVPVGTVVSTLVALWGAPARWVTAAGPHVHEDEFLTLDSSKAQRLLGWKPYLDLATMLTWTVEWYKACIGCTDARALCLQHIERYEELLRK